MALEDRQALTRFMSNLHGFVSRGLERHADALPAQYREDLVVLWSERRSTIEWPRLVPTMALALRPGIVEPVIVENA
jgi:hypothetical protein